MGIVEVEMSSRSVLFEAFPKCPEQCHMRKTCGRLSRNMSNTLNSLKWDIQGIIWGTTIGVIKGDTRSLDNGSYELYSKLSLDNSNVSAGSWHRPTLPVGALTY